MNRDQLAHVLRAAATIGDDGDIVVLGSQSILGTADADRLPDEATRSVEADVAFVNDPDESKMDRVDGAIGEDSPFHASFGYYGQGVTLETAVLPNGWQDRTIAFDRPDAEPSHARCLEPHDLVIAKLVAGREKDFEFVTALIAADLINIRILLDRVLLLDTPGAVQERVRRSIERCARRAGYG
ncbi:MAG: hypothetical protein KDB33_20215 [Acidimicrobiales bacterium]|nr:hypothetical protein [Acidimicrobiales bacterium]